MDPVDTTDFPLKDSSDQLKPDHTQAKEAKEAVEEALQRLQAAVESMRIGVTITDPQGKILYINRADAEMHGYCSEELIGKYARIFGPSECWSPMDLQELENIKTWKRDGLNVRKDGTIFHVELISELVMNTSGKMIGLVTTCEDITHRKKAEEELVRKGLYDPLTKLANRTLFIDRLEQAIKRKRRRQNYMFAVLFLDVDCFKTINDNFGHLCGDQVLIEIARRLVACSRPEDTIGRMGGDELTILLDGIQDPAEAGCVAERIRMCFVMPFHLPDREIHVTTSIGVVSNGREYNCAEDVIRDADVAMYRAKASGRGHYQIFEDMRAQNGTTEEQYVVSCHWCLEVMDGLEMRWCNCLSSERTLVCSQCFRCFCKAPKTYKETFWTSAPQVLWDRRAEEHNQRFVPGLNPEPWQLNRPFVLIVQFDKQIQRTATRLIQSLGYETILAQDGQEGLKLAKEYLPDLILTDALLPKIDGREMCRCLKQEPSTALIKVILMTSLYARAKYRSEAFLKFGVDEYVNLPLTFDELCALIHKFA